MNFLGIDPGLKGALALLDSSGRLLELADTPTVTAGSKRRYDESEMFSLLRAWMRRPVDGRTEHCRVALEHQQARPGQGVTSMFSTGYGFGLWVGMLASLGVGWEPIRPQAWRKVVGIPPKSEKSGSLLVASRLWPDAEIRGPRGGTLDGRADALLIAEAGRRINLGGSK